MAAEPSSHQQVLLEAGADPNSTISHQPTASTLLQWAVAEHHAWAVSALHQHGACLDCMGGLGRTGLHIAAEDSEGLGMAKQLLAAGANPNAADSDTGRTPLHLAVTAHNVPIVQALVLAGADPELPEHMFQQTPTALAHKKGNPEVMLALQQTPTDTLIN
eukprot:TRINITY_DN12808_c0_g1_i3.p4 TRINITY_DN12808_c0_g1~~TRINITY_DN12808_c0_g1_i3.p4  ORF type:complete len:161 (+),score=60.63 TRINITY_DN12808_c0_g1_i3:1454-1936(+)